MAVGGKLLIWDAESENHLVHMHSEAGAFYLFICFNNL